MVRATAQTFFVAPTCDVVLSIAELSPRHRGKYFGDDYPFYGFFQKVKVDST